MQGVTSASCTPMDADVADTNPDHWAVKVDLHCVQLCIDKRFM